MSLVTVCNLRLHLA